MANRTLLLAAIVLVLGVSATLAETDATSAAIRDLQHDLQIVRNQVDLLQIAANEKKAPWWRDKSLLIAALALVVSIVSSIYTNYDQSHERRVEDKKQRMASLDSMLTEIVGIRTEDAKQQATLATTNIAAYRAWNSTINMKRIMLLTAAKNLARGMPTVEVSPVAYQTIGNELITDGRYAEAMEYLDLGIESAKANNQPITYLLGAKAQIYLLPSQDLYDQVKGRAMYSEAIDSFTNHADYTSLNSKLNLILYWAFNESGFGFPATAAALLASAESLVDECQLPAAGKNPLRRLVDEAGAQLRSQSSAANLYDTSKWLGTWEVSDGGRAQGELSFLMVPGTPFASFSKAMLLDHTLVARQIGTVNVVNAEQIRLEWNGAFVAGPNGPYQIAGFSTVELNADGMIRGRDYQAGVPEKDWTARRKVDASGKRLRA